MAFLTERTEDAMLFPRPEDGAVVGISPPGLTWLPAADALGYQVEICDEGGTRVYEGRAVGTSVHLPDRVLAPGTYTWDVVALDPQGNEAARRGTQSFTVPEGVPELPWVDPEVLLARVPAGHPRLLYRKEDLPALRTTLGTTREGSWAACLRAAERALDMPAPVYPDYHLTEDRVQCRLEYKRYFADFRRYINSALMHLSLAFLMTGEAKYAEAGKRILLAVADWPTNDEDVSSVSAQWGDEPGLSLSRCAHRAYDWLYDALNDEERAKVLAMCEERAWQTYRRLVRGNYLTSPGKSHDGRLIAYLSEMAIAMAGESDGAKMWLDYSLLGLTTFYPHWGGHEGGWAEGIGYGLAYNQIYMPALEGLRVACDLDLWQRPFFRKVRYFFFYCTALRGEIRPFGDGADRGGPGTDPGGFAALLSFHGHRYEDPCMAWWAEQTGRRGGGGEMALVFEDEGATEPPTELPGSRVFRGAGWAALHSDLTQPEEDTFLLFKSSPYGSVSHSHADQNAFAIMKGGRALAIPSGYYGPAYGMPHHAEWTRATKANNCVLVNGAGQVIRSAKASGRITAFEDRKALSYVAGDAAAAYMGKMCRFDRHILFLRPGLFLVLDDLEAPEPARFKWLLHAFEKMEVDDAAGRIVSRRDGATLDVRLRSPAGLTLNQTDVFDTPYNAGTPEEFQEDRPNHWHVAAETQEEAGAARIGAVMAASGPGERFDVELLEREGWFGARASGAFGTVAGWVQLCPGAPGPEACGEDAVIWGRGADSSEISISRSSTAEI